MSQRASRLEHSVTFRRSRSVAHVAIICGFAFGNVFNVIGPCRNAAAQDAADLLRQGVSEREAGRHLASLGLFRRAVAEAPNEAEAYIKTAETLLHLWNGNRSPYEATSGGRNLWAAPADFRRHGEPPYRWSVLGEPGTPTKPAYDETYPIEAIEAWQSLQVANRLAPDDFMVLKQLEHFHV